MVLGHPAHLYVQLLPYCAQKPLFPPLAVHRTLLPSLLQSMQIGLDSFVFKGIGVLGRSVYRKSRWSE